MVLSAIVYNVLLKSDISNAKVTYLFLQHLVYVDPWSASTSLS